MKLLVWPMVLLELMMHYSHTVFITTYVGPAGFKTNIRNNTCTLNCRQGGMAFVILASEPDGERENRLHDSGRTALDRSKGMSMRLCQFPGRFSGSLLRNVMTCADFFCN